MAKIPEAQCTSCGDSAHLSLAVRNKRFSCFLEDHSGSVIAAVLSVTDFMGGRAR